MRKISLVLVISVSFVAGTMVAGNYVFADPEDSQNSLLDQVIGAIQSQEPVCPAENVQHWATYQWESGISFIHPTLPSVESGSLEVQVPSDRSYTGPEVVANTLNELGYSNSGSPILPVNVAGSFLANNMGVICVDGGIMAVVGGLLIQPDSATILLAYGIANAIWIAPIGIGIGVGIYLVKRRF